MRVTLKSGESIEITTVAERPDLAGKGFDAGSWPDFMRHNRISDAYFWRTLTVFPEMCLIATAPDGTVVADGHAVLFNAGMPERQELPPGGWEQIIVWAFSDHHRGIASDTAGALNISVEISRQRQGLAGHMLAAMRAAASTAGLSALVAPVRPTHKTQEPRTPISDYLRRQQADGRPYDPWLATHVRAGGRIAGAAPTSWVITGTLEQWREWTGLPFGDDGEVEVPGALVPVRCDSATGIAVYVEPNIWVRHDLSPGSRIAGDVKTAASAPTGR